MASPMSGDARPPPRGAAPYALYQFGTSGAAVAVATAVVLHATAVLAASLFWAPLQTGLVGAAPPHCCLSGR